MASVLAILVVWWIPPLAEMQARRAKLDELSAGVADLEKRGGKAKLQICKGPHLCIRTDEAKGTFEGAAKGETYRVIKGY